MTYCHVDLFAREVDMMQRRGNTKVNAGMLLGKVAEPMHQPFGSKVRRSADSENACVLPLQQPLGANRNPIQRVAYDREVVPACFCNDEPLALAVEKLDRQFSFKRLDLMADRTLGDAQLFRRAGKALVPGGGFKSLQCIQRRQART